MVNAVIECIAKLSVGNLPLLSSFAVNNFMQLYYDIRVIQSENHRNFFNCNFFQCCIYTIYSIEKIRK